MLAEQTIREKFDCLKYRGNELLYIYPKPFKGRKVLFNTAGP